MKKQLYIFGAAMVMISFAGCAATQTAITTNETVNTNGDAVAVNADLNTNAEQGDDTNANAATENGNVNADTTDVTVDTTGDTTVDSSDWLTYTNEEYGFSFRYPTDWTINGNNSNHVGVIVEKLDDLSVIEKVAPTSSSSPELQDQNETEKNNLESSRASAFGGTFVNSASTNFFRYVGYIEGGSIDIEYVTYLDDNKVTIRYLEGDNIDFVNALNDLGRTALLKQYRDSSIDSLVLKQNFEILGKIIETFQK